MKGPALGFGGKLINPSGSETVLDQITSDGTHLHFAVNKLNLSYDGIWNDQEKVWKGNLTFQQIYPLVLKRASAEDMGPAAHKQPQEDAINVNHLLQNAKTGAPSEYNDIRRDDVAYCSQNHQRLAD